MNIKIVNIYFIEKYTLTDTMTIIINYLFINLKFKIKIIIKYTN